MGIIPLADRVKSGTPIRSSSSFRPNGGAAQPTQVNVFPLNSAVDSTSGLDVSASYTHPLLDGAMTWAIAHAI